MQTAGGAAMRIIPHLVRRAESAIVTFIGRLAYWKVDRDGRQIAGRQPQCRRRTTRPDSEWTLVSFPKSFLRQRAETTGALGVSTATLLSGELFAGHSADDPNNFRIQPT